MDVTTHKTYRVQAMATPDAVQRALAMARIDRLVVIDIGSVALAGQGWDVTLVVKAKA